VILYIVTIIIGFVQVSSVEHVVYKELFERVYTQLVYLNNLKKI